MKRHYTYDMVDFIDDYGDRLNIDEIDRLMTLFKTDEGELRKELYKKRTKKNKEKMFALMGQCNIVGELIVRLERLKNILNHEIKCKQAIEMMDKK